LESIAETTTAIAVRNAPKCDQAAANELVRVLNEMRQECCLDALKKRIDERLRYKKSCTILERDLARVWPRDERDQLKREKEIHAFAAANGWLATILDPGVQVTFRKVGI
jgi:hypothetical protein